MGPVARPLRALYSQNQLCRLPRRLAVEHLAAGLADNILQLMEEQTV